MTEPAPNTIRLIRFERDKIANLSMNPGFPTPAKHEDILSIEFAGLPDRVFKGERARILEVEIRKLIGRV